MIPRPPALVLLAIVVLAVFLINGFIRGLPSVGTSTMQIAPFIPMFFFAVTHLIKAALLVAMAFGSNAARLAFTGFYFYGVITFVAFLASLPSWPNLGIVGSLVYLLPLAAVVLLYVPSSNRWFRSRAATDSPQAITQQPAAPRLTGATSTRLWLLGIGCAVSAVAGGLLYLTARLTLSFWNCPPPLFEQTRPACRIAGKQMLAAGGAGVLALVLAAVAIGIYWHWRQGPGTAKPPAAGQL
ncbi:MAG: hypothetical protein ABWY06_12730 [Pseudomonas sp.]|uniref:hypothetical protein n=1 Tax=Pseudomonas sp. TaxID=306 RepID=UPI003399F9A1